jgi:hypothetical protein
VVLDDVAAGVMGAAVLGALVWLGALERIAQITGG